jgi:hypothetical protein
LIEEWFSFTLGLKPVPKSKKACVEGTDFTVNSIYISKVGQNIILMDEG